MALTRDCIDPWTTAIFSSTGSVDTCCGNISIGNIYDTDSDKLDLNLFLNSKVLKELRKSLLTGNLCEKCRKCVIHRMISVEDFKKKVQNFYNTGYIKIDEDENVLNSDLFYLDITSHCNFKCIYCNHSAPGFKPVNMKSEYIEALVNGSRDRHVRRITLSAGGETTTYKGWDQLVLKIIAQNPDTAISIISNLGRRYSKDELYAFSKLYNMSISCDTLDPALFKMLRTGDVSMVLENINNIRLAAANDNRVPPFIGITCVLCNLDYKTIPDLADYTIANRLHLDFTDIKIYPNTAGFDKLKHIYDMTDDEMLEARDIINDTIEKFKSKNGSFFFHSDMLDKLFAKCTKLTKHEFIPGQGSIIYHQIYKDNPKGLDELILKRYTIGSQQFKGIFIKKGISITFDLPKGVYKISYFKILLSSNAKAQTVKLAKGQFTIDSDSDSDVLITITDCKCLDFDFDDLINSTKEAILFMKNHNSSSEITNQLLSNVESAFTLLISNGISVDFVSTLSEKVNLLKLIIKYSEIVENDLYLAYRNRILDSMLLDISELLNDLPKNI